MTKEKRPNAAATVENAADAPSPIDADDLPDTDLARVHGGSATAALTRGAIQDACFTASTAKTAAIH
ncbi:hypothetical protein W911_03000 [Hyphomicrobium nitrativorans NL23]|uniref:Uncharacterized protein n=1 Tax=Hyphomicrobium nitrativorans NL23 TaxID=1029756 RepID=V5SII4_9HYPH|nr:hypothetical protein [Hyphomicrobium nitrativorans]AHB49875.1 hypothetical protein W911_03000 [Hyphomicrobium nitrativorans NL23]